MANSGSHHYSGRKALSEIDRKEKKRQYKTEFSSAVTFEYLQVPGGGGSLPQKAVIHVLPVPGQILSDAVLGGVVVIVMIKYALISPPARVHKNWSIRVLV